MFPEVHIWMQTLRSLSRKASWSMMKTIFEKIIDAIAQPCLVQINKVNVSDALPWSCTMTTMPSWEDRITSTNVSGQPTFANSCQSRVPLTAESTSSVWPTKTMYDSWFCSRYVSCIYLIAKIMSVLPRYARKPHWLSCRTISFMCSAGRCSIIRTSILPDMYSRLSSQMILLPFRL